MRLDALVELACAAIRSGEADGVPIAVIDSGVTFGDGLLFHHRIAHRVAIVRRPESFEPVYDHGGDGAYEQHGTHVCAIIARCAPRARIGTFTVRGPRGPEAIACAAYAAIELGYRIINCSFAHPGDDLALRAYKGWTDLAYSRGVHVVASDSNGRRGEVWPAWFPTVVGVTWASIADGDIASANRPDSPLVEFAANGSAHDSALGAMTSFAAPRVASMLGRLIGQVPDLTPLEAKAILRRLATRSAQERALFPVP